MGHAIKITRSFSIDSDLALEIDRTKGSRSASEHVNNLIKLGLALERRSRLEEEARQFFEDAPDDREERRAFQKANLKTWERA